MGHKNPWSAIELRVDDNAELQMSSEIGLGGVAQLEEPQMGVEMKGPESEDDLLTSSPWEPVESFSRKLRPRV